MRTRARQIQTEERRGASRKGKVLEFASNVAHRRKSENFRELSGTMQREKEIQKQREEVSAYDGGGHR